MPEQNSSISSFKRFLYRILLPLTAVMVVAGWLFSYAFERWIIMNSEISGAYKINRMINETHPDEIPIIGSSRAEGSYIPDSLGTNFFNYGLRGSYANVAIFFLQQECRKKKNRPWIIINVDLVGLTHRYDNIANFIPNCNNEEIRNLLGEDYKTYYRIPFIRYLGEYEYYVRDYLNNKMQLTKTPCKGAAIEKNAPTLAQFGAVVAHRRANGDTLKTDRLLLNKLTGIITMHPDRRFVFVVAPYHKSYYESYVTPASADSFLHLLGSFPNTYVLDFGHMPLADSMYFNTSHLHFNGAAKFSRTLRDSLVAMGVQ